MKICLLFLFVFTFQIMALNTKAQDAVIELKSNSVTINELINEIEKQTDYLVVYSNREVDTNRKIDFKSKSNKVFNYLDEAFSNTDIGYNFENDYIVLSKRSHQNTIDLSQLTQPSQQQGRTITGKVTDLAGEPVIGATIVLKDNPTHGATTDVDGNFSLTNLYKDAVLQITYVGMKSQEINLRGRTVINIIMESDIELLSELVVIGYGTQKKGEVASAIHSIKSDNFIKTPSTDPAQLIRGKVPGLQITTTNSDPTSTSEISLRGITTLKSSTSPLVLIDGIPGALNSVSPDDIEQIDVLRDGSAAAIYGTRGTNGVILITTRNAKGEMATEVDVNAYISTQQIIKRLPFMNAAEYRQRAEEGVPGAQDDGSTVDWLDEVIRTPVSQIYNISLRGGSKSTNYVASFGYHSLNGLMKSSDNAKYYPRIEITHRMFKNKVKINAGLSGYKQTYFTSGDGSSFNKEIYRNALIYNPTTPVYQEDGNYSFSDKNAYDNPVALQNEVEGENLATNFRMFANFIITPIEGLDIKYLVSSDTYNQVRGYFRSRKHPSSVNSSQNGFASRGTIRTANDMSEFTTQYRKVINAHSFTALAGYSWQKNTHQFYWMQNYDFPSDETTYHNMGSGEALKNGKANEHSEANESKLIGFFGRINYSYKEKYMFATSIRHEGSSKFGANHKWGNFPSVSAGWNIIGEDFMRDVNFFSALKFRVGYGVTGTEPSSSYISLRKLSFGSYVYYNGEWIKTIRPSSNTNPDLRWEKKKEINVGLDFGFFNDHITGSIDYYNRKTEDLIWDYDVPLPPYLYGTIVANAGSMGNKGIEIGINVIPIQTNKFQWISNINYSRNKNILTSLSNDTFISSGYSNQGSTGEPLQTYTHRIEEGEPIGNFFGYKTIDIDDYGYWIIEGYDGQPKSIKEAIPSDKKVIGNGLPKYYLNFNNTISWNNFDFSLTMRGAFGFDILNMPRLQYGAPVMLARGNVLNEAFDVKFNNVPLSIEQSLEYVDYYIEKGDYWKIDNLTLGYTFNTNTWIKKLRLYGMISNLASISGYSGIDPEVSVKGLAPAIDNKSRYPSARTYTLGLSLKF